MSEYIGRSMAEHDDDVLLEGGGPLSVVVGAVDYRGRPVIRSKSGSWRSASFIIGTVLIRFLDRAH